MANTISINVEMSDAGISEAIDFLSGFGPKITATSEAVVDGGAFAAAPPPATEDAAEAAPSETETTEFAKSSDGQMIPWDERIHSKNRTVNQDGSWKLKRGVDKDELKKIEAELIVAAMVATDDGTAPESESEPPAPPTPPAPVEPAGAVLYKHGDRTFTKEDLLAAKWSEEQIATLETVPVEPEAPAAPTPPAPVQTGEPLTFAEVAMRINSKGIDKAEVNAKVAELAAKHGKANVANFAFLATPANAAILADLVAEYEL